MIPSIEFVHPVMYNEARTGLGVSIFSKDWNEAYLRKGKVYAEAEIRPQSN